MDLALQTLLESDKSGRIELRFDRIYPHVHFIPMTEQGIRLLRLLNAPDWKERVLFSCLSGADAYSGTGRDGV